MPIFGWPRLRVNATGAFADWTGVDMGDISPRSPWFPSPCGYAALADSILTGRKPTDAMGYRRAKISQAVHEVGAVIYGVLTTDGLIKFGHSVNLLNRLAAYGISIKNPKRLLMVVPGGLDDEQILLARFIRHLARGKEFFHPAREIIDYINAERDRMGVPDLPF